MLTLRAAATPSGYRGTDVDRDFHPLGFISNPQNHRCWGTLQRAGHSGLMYPLGF